MRAAPLHTSLKVMVRVLKPVRSAAPFAVFEAIIEFWTVSESLTPPHTPPVSLPAVFPATVDWRRISVVGPVAQPA